MPPEEIKYEIILNSFEAAVVMRLCGNVGGRTKERNTCGQIYEHLRDAGAKSDLAKKPTRQIEFQE